MKNKFQVIAEYEEGGWALTFPGYPGAYSQGEDEAEVESMAKDLINFMLEIPIEDIELDITYIPEAAIAK